MILEEEYTFWKPLKKLYRYYSIDDILDNQDAHYEIVFTPYYFSTYKGRKQHKNIKVLFKDSVEYHNSTDESFRHRLIHELSEKNGEKFHQHSFFKVKNSKLLPWLLKQSCNTIDISKMTHFSFMGVNSILDVVATYEPEIKFID